MRCICAIFALLLCGGCLSSTQRMELDAAVQQVFGDLGMGMTASAFVREHGQLPQDIEQLAAFAEQHPLPEMLRFEPAAYQSVSFSQQADGTLEVTFHRASGERGSMTLKADESQEALTASDLEHWIEQLIGAEDYNNALLLLFNADPIELAQERARRGETRYFGVGGFAARLPGLEQERYDPERDFLFPGTTDAIAHPQQAAWRTAALRFAQRYNESLYPLRGGTSAPAEPTGTHLSEKKVVAIAEPELANRYPKSFERYQPYRAKYDNGIWHVYGTLRVGVGGTPEAYVRDSDGAIIRITHGR